VPILGVRTSKNRSGALRSDPGGDPDRSAKLWIIAEPVIVFKIRLPFSDQLKALKFDNTDMTRFVKKWDNIYENCKIKTIKKTRRIPKYIIKIIGKYIRAQKEYEKQD